MNEPAKYRKKPVVIEAMEIRKGGLIEVRDWVNGNNRGQGPATVPLIDDCLIIKTLEGDMKGALGWWVIRGVEGEFYPCEPAIFAKTYEPA